MERFVERFRYKATKARQAQSKLKGIERLKAATRPSRPARRAHARVLVRRRRALRAGGARARAARRSRAGDRTLIDDAEMWLERGEHVCLVGAERLGQDDAGRDPGRQPRARRGQAARAATTSSSATSPSTPRSPASPSAHRARPRPARDRALGGEDAGACSGRFLFSGEEVEKRLAEISGGEAQRLALALLTNSDANLLILDEPTNHLDVESREALEDALHRFDGTRAADLPRPGAARGGRQPHGRDRGRGALRSHPGGWAEYRSAVEAERGRARRARRRAEGRRRAGPPGRARTARRELARLEREVEEAEAASASGSRTSSPTRRIGPTPGALGAGDRAPRAGAGEARRADRALGGGRRSGSRAERGRGLSRAASAGSSASRRGGCARARARAASAAARRRAARPSSPDSSISSMMSQPPTSSPLT